MESHSTSSSTKEKFKNPRSKLKGYSPEKTQNPWTTLVMWDFFLFCDFVFEFLQVPPKSQGKARHVQVGIKDNGGIQKQEEIVSYYDNELIFS